MSIESFNHLVAILTLLSLFSLLLLFIPSIRVFVAQYGLLMGFIICLGGVGVSFYYSNVAHYAPCILCWYQRIFFVPQIFILGLAVYKKDFGVRLYSLTLAILGGVIALYQVLLEHGLALDGVCGTNGVSCTARYVYEYGFVTIPFMSLVGFLLIGISVYCTKYREVTV